MINLKIDEELRDLLPPLTDEELNKLEESILQNGLQDKIKIWTDSKTGISYIVDGHNRYSVCKKNNINIETNVTILDNTKYATKDDIIEYMITYQLGRRNMSKYDRFQIIQKYKPLLEKKAKQNNSDAGKGSTILPKVDTRKEMAKMVGVSEGTYAKLDKIDKSDNEELKKKVKNKEVSIDKAYKEVVEPKVKEFTTDDCQREIDKIQREMRILEYASEQMRIKKALLFDKNKSEVKCNYEIELGFLSSKVKFYFVYDGNTKERYIGEVSVFAFEKLSTLETYLSIMGRKENLSKKEKEVLYNKAVEIKEEVVEREKIHTDNFYAQIEQNTKKKTSPMIEEIITAGYKTLAKKYHPDVTNDNGGLMKELNAAKEQLLKIC